MITGQVTEEDEQEEHKLPVLINVCRANEKDPEITYPFQGYVFKAYAEDDFARNRHRGVVKMWMPKQKYGFIRVENSDREAYFKSDRVPFCFCFCNFFF